MPLDKVSVEIPFTQGLDTRTDEKLVIAGKLLKLENGRFLGNTLAKRLGSTKLSNNIASGGTLSGTQAVATFKSELLRFGSQGLHSYAAASDNWVQRGNTSDTVFTTLSRQRVVRTSNSQKHADCVTVGNISVYVYEDWTDDLSSSAPNIHGTVIDNATGALYLSDVLIEGSARRPRLVVVGSSVYVFFISGTNIRMSSIPSAAPTAFSSPISVRTDACVGIVPDLFELDAVAAGSNIALAYASGSAAPFLTGSGPYEDDTNEGTGITLVLLTTSGSLATAPNTCAINLGGQHGLSLVRTNSGGYLVFAQAHVSGQVKQATISSSLTVSSTQTVDSAPGHMVEATCAATLDNTNYYVFVGLRNGAGVRRATVTASSVVSTGATAFRRARFTTKPFAYNGALYIGLTSCLADTTSGVQPTAFVVNGVTGDTVVRGLPSSAAGSNEARGVLALSSTTFGLLFSERGRLVVESGAELGKATRTNADRTRIGLSLLKVSFVAADEVPKELLGDALHIGGGLPQVYAGKTLVEENFNLFPEGITAAVTASTGGLSIGAYQARFVYEWVDTQGNLHRSAPSDAVAFNVATFGSHVTYTIPTLGLTRRLLNSPSFELTISVYRTEANGTLFYKASSVDSPLFNSEANDVTSYTDSLTDTDLVSRELLYTQGGSVDRLPPPAYKYSCVHGKRLVVAGLEDEFEARYSLEEVPGEAVAFSDEFSLRVPESAGAITAVASMDGHLFFFTATGIFVVTGDGPDETGGNNTFSDPQSIHSDVGCINWKTIARVPEGLVFLSAKGIYLLTRALQLQYIGADVETYNTLNLATNYVFSKATLLKNETQVRWLCSVPGDGDTAGTAITLVYDYAVGQWATRPACSGRDTALWNDKFLRVRIDGNLMLDSTSSYLDDTTNYDMVVETGWLKLSGLMGFMRAYELQLLGRFASIFTLTLQVWTDYDTSTTADTVTWTPDPGSLAGPPQVSHRLSRQKCEALKFRLTITSSGEGVALTAFNLVCGMKRGAYRLPASRRV